MHNWLFKIMKNKKNAAVIVTYYPDIEVLANLERVANSVDHLIVVDNTPEGADFNDLNYENITFLKSNRNVGLSKALNDGINHAASLDYHNIFLFDQDSKPTDHFFDSMLNFKQKIDNEILNCAFYVPNFYDRNSQTYAKYPLLSSFFIKHLCCTCMKPYYPGKSLIAITSGTLLSYDRYLEIGPFPEDYFIDFIDNEYCLRAARKGFIVAVNCNAILNHSIGNRTKKNFFWIQVKPNNHPAFRRYYISRNGIRTAIIYGFDYKFYFFLIFLRLFHEALSILFFEDNKSCKMGALIRGCIDGMLGKMGPCPYNF